MLAAAAGLHSIFNQSLSDAVLLVCALLDCQTDLQTELSSVGRGRGGLAAWLCAWPPLNRSASVTSPFLLNVRAKYACWTV